MKRVVIGVACCGPPPPPPRLHPRLFRSPVPFHSAVGSSRGSPRLPPGSPGFASTRSIVFYYGRLGHSNPPLFVVPFPMRTPHESHSTSSRFFFSRDFSRRLILADFFFFFVDCAVLGRPVFVVLAPLQRRYRLIFSTSNSHQRHHFTGLLSLFFPFH